MKIYNDNITIRSAKVDDAEILNQWWNDGTVMEHAGFPNGLNQSIDKTIDVIKQNEVKISQLCIIEIDNKRVGEMNYNIYKDDNIAEIGIKICDSNYQNKGYGKILLKMFIEYLFNNYELNNQVHINKIILDTNLNNERAQYIYEKIGFKKIRVNIDSWKDQLGNLQSSVDYEMTRNDFLNNN